MKRLLTMSLLLSAFAFPAHAQETSPPQPLAGEARHPRVDIVELIATHQRQQTINQAESDRLNRELMRLSQQGV